MTTEAAQALAVCGAPAAYVGLTLAAAAWVHDRTMNGPRWSPEAKNVMSVFLGLLWPMIAIAVAIGMAVRGLVYFGRGVAGIWRALRPQRSQIPIARVVANRRRRDGHHINDGCGPEGCPPEPKREPDESWGKDPWFGGEP